MYIDSHAHIASNELFDSHQEILTRAKDANISHIVNICTDLTTLERGLSIQKQTPWVVNAGATTPHDVESEGEKYFKHFEQAARSGLLVAVGETGLDYYYEHSNQDIQKAFFIRYLELAKACSLPVIIHCRDAFEDFFKIIDQHYPPPFKGVLHCFTGTQDDARRLVDRGWYISLSGIVTFKKSLELQKVAQETPLKHLFIETDSPYLAPQKYRGKTNEPAFVVEVAKLLATLKQQPLEEIAHQTSHNAKLFFNLR